MPTCQGKTKDGYSCSRQVPSGEKYCWQHKAISSVKAGGVSSESRKSATPNREGDTKLSRSNSMTTGIAVYNQNWDEDSDENDILNFIAEALQLAGHFVVEGTKQLGKYIAKNFLHQFWDHLRHLIQLGQQPVAATYHLAQTVVTNIAHLISTTAHQLATIWSAYTAHFVSVFQAIQSGLIAIVNFFAQIAVGTPLFAS